MGRTILESMDFSKILENCIQHKIGLPNRFLAKKKYPMNEYIYFFWHLLGRKRYTGWCANVYMAMDNNRNVASLSTNSIHKPAFLSSSNDNTVAGEAHNMYVVCV